MGQHVIEPSQPDSSAWYEVRCSRMVRNGLRTLRAMGRHSPGKRHGGRMFCGTTYRILGFCSRRELIGGRYRAA